MPAVDHNHQRRERSGRASVGCSAFTDEAQAHVEDAHDQAQHQGDDAPKLGLFGGLLRAGVIAAGPLAVHLGGEHDGRNARAEGAP